MKVDSLIIGVIGCGNMASAIVCGVHAVHTGIRFKTYTPSKTKAVTLATKVEGVQVDDLGELIDCDILFIGCKPQQFSTLEQDLMKAGLDKHFFISMMAAISFKRLSHVLRNARFSRVMPNTPIRNKEGITLLLSDDRVTKDEHQVVNKLFSSCSLVQEVQNESQFDDVTVVSGSGPAYLFYFAHCFQVELIKMGLKEKESADVVAQLFIGSSKLMLERGDLSFEQLLDQVTSKGGVTIEAIKVLKGQDIQNLIHIALGKAMERSIEMSHSF